MKKTIKDIKVVGPEDKLIILVDVQPNEKFEEIAKIADEFMSMKNKRVLCMASSLRPFIIKKGAKVALSAVIEKMLEQGD